MPMVQLVSRQGSGLASNLSAGVRRSSRCASSVVPYSQTSTSARAAEQLSKQEHLPSLGAVWDPPPEPLVGGDVEVEGPQVFVGQQRLR